jgi:hypothetical protein
MSRRSAQNPRNKAIGLVTKAENPRHAEQLLQGYNYELAKSGRSLQDRKEFWSEVSDLFQVSGFDLQASSEVKKAASSAMKRLAENGEPKEKLKTVIQFEDAEEDLQSVLGDLSRELNAFIQSRGIGHVEEFKEENGKAVLHFRLYQAKDAFDQNSTDVPTLADALNRHELKFSFEIYRLKDGNEVRLYYTEPKFPEDDYRKYGAVDGFELKGRYIPHHQEHARAEFHVFAVRENEERQTTGFTQKAVAYRADVNHMPEGEIEGRLSELAHLETVRRIQETDFERDGICTIRYEEDAISGH